MALQTKAGVLYNIIHCYINIITSAPTRHMPGSIFMHNINYIVPTHKARVPHVQMYHLAIHPHRALGDLSSFLTPRMIYIPYLGCMRPLVTGLERLESRGRMHIRYLQQSWMNPNYIGIT